MAFLCCCSSFARSQKMPDLSLSLVSSSNSFLNALIVDKDSRKPVYSIDTVESLTTIMRQTAPTAAHRGREPRTRSHTGSPPSQSLVASVQWPERSPHIVPLRAGPPQSGTIVNPTRDEDAVRVHLDDGSATPLPRFLKRRSQALYVLSSFRPLAPFPSVALGLIIPHIHTPLSISFDLWNSYRNQLGCPIRYLALVPSTNFASLATPQRSSGNGMVGNTK
jgi:hypothetical protein